MFAFFWQTADQLLQAAETTTAARGLSDIYRAVDKHCLQVDEDYSHCMSVMDALAGASGASTQSQRDGDRTTGATGTDVGEVAAEEVTIVRRTRNYAHRIIGVFASHMVTVPLSLRQCVAKHVD
jgi:hypothetical protein